MAHSVVVSKDRTYIVRDDILLLIIKQFEKYSEKMNIGWLSHACKEWLEHCDVMPPGAKRIELDRWIPGDQERRQFMAAIDFVSQEIQEAKLTQLMHLSDLRACVEP